jgi:hypothetical protein
MGVLISEQDNTIIKLPTMALAKPPPSDPGAGVLSRNIETSSAEKPFINKMLKIQSKKLNPTAIAVMESNMPMKLTRLRFA